MFTNASEHVTTKSEARNVFLRYKTYSVRQNKQNSREPLHSGHLQTTDTKRLSQAVRYMEGSTVLPTNELISINVNHVFEQTLMS